MVRCPHPSAGAQRGTHNPMGVVNGSMSPFFCGSAGWKAPFDVGGVIVGKVDAGFIGVGCLMGESSHVSGGKS